MNVNGRADLPLFDMLAGLGLRALFDMVERKKGEVANDRTVEHFVLDWTAKCNGLSIGGVDRKHVK